MRHFKQIFSVLSLAAVFAVPAFGQETELKVVDEVVAQVNDGVITLSRIRREMKDAVDSMVQQGKTREEAQKTVDEKQGELIANLVNEELLIQRAKELGLEKEIEKELNERFVQIMKENDLKTVEALYEEMSKTGVDPQEVREGWRKQITRDLVIQREVQAKIYWGLPGKELKDYFEKNKARFTKPETISISELFIGFAGRNEADVRAKAKQIHTQLKAGAEFDKLVAENSDPGVVTNGTGKAQNLKVADLVDVLAKPLKDVKVGAFTEPFDANELGVVILRVDQREKASSDSVFDENAVRLAIMTERFPAEQSKFMAKVRNDSYIKISESYRPLVSPILFADERKQKTGN
jgi:predicted RNase H-like HicB family nuclease